MEIRDPKLSSCYKEMYVIGSHLHILVQIGIFAIPYFYAFGQQILMKLCVMHISQDVYFKSICLEYIYVGTNALLNKDFKLIYCDFSVYTGLEDRRSSVSKVAGL